MGDLAQNEHFFEKLIRAMQVVSFFFDKTFDGGQ